jgi:choline dehydrogenase
VVVAGAGTAGCALAARLAERGLHVVLLEAGPAWSAAAAPVVVRQARAHEVRNPSRFPEFQWPSLTARRTAVQPAKPYVRGRGLGGSSIVNSQMAMRPPLDDFDGWAAGDQWSAGSVLDAFVRLEDDADYASEPYHGADGPVPVVRAPRHEWSFFERALEEAALVDGVRSAPDVNAPNAYGVSPCASHSRGGRRVTTYDAYLVPAERSRPLEVRPDTLVDRVVVRNGRAVGVDVVTAGRRDTILAGEVVLCAGSPYSTAILQRSGIGPSDLLTSRGIDVVADLPVGHFVQDHPLLGLYLPLADPRPAPNGRHANCVLRFASGVPGSVEGDVMVILVNPIDANDLATVAVIVNACRSYGSIAIADRAPDVEPCIDERMLDDPLDRAVGRWAVRHALDLIARSGLALAAPVLDGRGTPVEPAMSDAELDAWMLATAADAAHLTGGCRIGAASESDAVVDGHCCVRGVDGLRIIDLSIAPRVPRAAPFLAAVAIGECGADLVAADRAALLTRAAGAP